MRNVRDLEVLYCEFVFVFDRLIKFTLLLKIISERKSLLRIEIQDNGKGRGNNRSENSFNELGKKKSMAVDLTQQRLSLLDSKNAKLEIVDLYLDNGAPAGTKVILHLPLIIDGKKVESSFNR